MGAKTKRYAIIGSSEEAERVCSIIKQSKRGTMSFTYVSPDKVFENEHFVGPVDQLNEIVTIYKINEVIFCAKNLSSQLIISSMSALDPGITCKIAPPESMYIIGSNSIESSGDLYMLDINSINKANNKRTKRSIDILFSILFILLSPILIFIVKHPSRFLRNIFQVLIGKKTWVAYANYNSESISQLPRIKEGVLSPVSDLGPINDLAFSNKLNIIYAKDYKASTDIRMILKGLKLLGK